MSSLFRDIKISGSKRDQISVNCPFCVKRGKGEDTKQHLFININNSKFICHRCQMMGPNIYRVIPELKYHKDFAKSDLLEWFEEKKKEYYNLEDISVPLVESDKEFNYIRGRGLDMRDVEKYDLRKGIDDYKGRLIVPNFELGTGRCDYFIARSIYKDAYLRYKNPPSSRTSILLNYYNSYPDPLVILTEGWFTGRAFGHNFASSLGTQVSNIQSVKLASIRELAYCPDGDVGAAIIMKNLKMIMRYREHVYLIPIPRIAKMDAEDLNPDALRKAFRSAKKFYRKDLKITYKKLDAWYESIFPLNVKI